jgi:hypothetical protein
MRHRPECIWEFRMNLSCKACAIAVLVAAGSLAYAAPPTVTPSPGYDARLQEQRAATSTAAPPSTAPPPAMPATPHRHKKSKSN